MPHLEPVESRQLFTASGLDPTFGNAGVVTLDKGLFPNIVLGLKSAIYVAASETTDGGGEINYLFKLNAAGTIDRGFGDRGHVVLKIAPVQLAYDRWFDRVYVAGQSVGEDGDVQGIYVQRFSARTGTGSDAYAGPPAVDGTYVAGYRPELGGNAHISTQVRSLVARPHGRVLLGIDAVVTEVGADTAAPSPTRGHYEVSLLQFDNDGRRDKAFGRRGVRTVLQGVYVQGQAINGPFGYTETSTYDQPQFRDLRVRADGGVHVAATRLVLTDRSGSPTRLPDQASEAVVESRTVAADGTIDAARSRTWSLGTNPARVADDTFPPRLLRAVGAAARDDDGVTAFATLDRAKVQVFALRPGVAPSPTTVTLPSAAATDPAYVTVIPFATGVYLQNDEESIAKLTANGTLDAAFADAGVAKLPGGVFYQYGAEHADSAGRLFLRTEETIRRFA